MTQYTLKKGLKKFQERGEAAVAKEMLQLHEMEVFIPKFADDMTEAEKDGALESLIFLKEKRDGTIKGRACADGRKQRENSPKSEATSPTAAVESVLITATVDAHEERDVAIADVPGAFLTADMDEVVHMVLRGKLAELMAKAVPQIYRKYVTLENGRPVLYVQLAKALYGCLKSAKLFYDAFVEHLTDKGFKINPYDPCVANKTVNGKQFTIVWHVDDLKLSHVDEKEVTKMLDWLKSIYGDRMRITRGKIHDYLGMTLDFTTRGELRVTMVDYLKQAIEDFPEKIEGSAATPAGNHLFTVRPKDEAQALDEERAMAFHHTVAQLLFSSARSRRDIQTAVAFLATRVREPDEDDWLKVKRLLRYINGTINLPLILRVFSMSVIKWWIDASFAVHADCRGHTGGAMSLGKGCVTSATRKQKINTRSSTEAELVGVDDLMPQMLWTRYFIEEQGFAVEECVLNQDNLSAMLLEKNGKESSTKRTKHIRVRYYFIKDRIQSGDITLEHCPTEEMVADHFTKPLQGTLFRKFRAEIQGIDLGDTQYDLGCDSSDPTYEPSPQECVGEPDKNEVSGTSLGQELPRQL